MSQGIISEKEAEIRASLALLDDAVNSDRPLSSNDIATLRRQLEDSSSMVLEQSHRSEQVLEGNEILVRRRDELETRLATMDSDYKELLDRTIDDDELADGATVQNIKVGPSFSIVRADADYLHNATEQTRNSVRHEARSCAQRRSRS